MMDTVSNVKKLEEKKEHLLTVKDTILYLKEQNQLRRAEVSESSERLTVSSNVISKNSTDNATLSRTPAVIILMVLSGITAVLFLCSWIQIEGYEINLFKLASQAENLTYILGSSESYSGVVAFLWFICLLQCVFAAIYIYIIYALYKNMDVSFIYFAMFGTIIIFIIVWFIKATVNSGIDDVYSGLSYLISADMTWKAWAALIAACVSGVIYSKQNQINNQLAGTDESSEKQMERTVPVVNYYPWEDIKFTDVVLKQQKGIEVSLKYMLPSAWRLQGYSERWNDHIVVNADVVIKVFRKEFVIYDQLFDVEWEYKKGSTEPVFLDYLPFKINDVDGVQVIIRSIQMPGGQKRQVHNVYAVSDMNSDELERYREHVNYEDAVCKEEKLDHGWKCLCGLIHNDTVRRCTICGTAISQDGKFIQ